MEYRLLGPLQVVDGEQSLPIGGTTRRALLAYLLLRANHVVSSDELIEALWNGSPPHTAASSLQNHVSRLRRVLGAERLVTRERGYELRVEPGELDVDRLATLVDEAEVRDPPGRSAVLRQALALWRGRSLAELDSFDFAREEGLRLEERRLDIVEECLEAELAAGRGDSVVSELRALVGEHPLRERLRGQLMLALYAHGRQAEALEVYRVGREALVEEAGLEPGPALRQLERAILRQDVPLPPAARSGTGSGRHLQRRRWRKGVSFTVLAFAALATVAGLLLLDGGPSPALAEIGANSLGVIDLERNELVATISVGQRPVSVAVGAQSVWVANAADGTVSRIDVSERRLVENIDAQTDFGMVRVGRGAVWTVGRLGRNPNYVSAVSRIDPAVNAVTASARHAAVSIRYDESLGIETGFGSVWVTAGWRLLRLDDRGRLVRAFEEFSSARGLAVGHDAVWVGDIAQPATGASTVVRIDPETDEVAAKIPVAAEIAAVAVGEDAVWVASDNGTLTRIDPVANVVSATLELGGALSGVAVAPDAVWVANSGARNVARVDFQTNEVVETIDTGARPEAIAVGEGAVWVTAY